MTEEKDKLSLKLNKDKLQYKYPFIGGVSYAGKDCTRSLLAYHRSLLAEETQQEHRPDFSGETKIVWLDECGDEVPELPEDRYKPNVKVVMNINEKQEPKQTQTPYEKARSRIIMIWLAGVIACCLAFKLIN